MADRSKQFAQHSKKKTPKASVIKALDREARRLGRFIEQFGDLPICPSADTEHSNIRGGRHGR